MTPAPANLDQLRHIPDPTQRAIAAKAYIAERVEALASARRIRDDAIAVLLSQGGKPADVARLCGVSASHVKFVKRLGETNG